MSVSSSPPKFSGFIQRLVQNGEISPIDMQNALQSAKTTQQDIVSYLVKQHQLCSHTIATTIADEYEETLFDLEHYDIAQLPHQYIDIKLILQYRIVPLFQHAQTLHVAMSNPTHIAAIDAFHLSSQCQIRPILVEYDKLEQFIHQHFENLTFNFEDFIQLESDISSHTPLDETLLQDETSPIVKYVNKLLRDAIDMRASDLHFEPYEKTYRIRYRIDGVLRHIATPPRHIAHRINARLKVMAQLDITEKRLPQDGRLQFPLSPQKHVDFRLSTVATLFGEKLVLRILDRSNAMLSIDALGYEDEQKALFLEALHRPQGMLLITGPTGSGKTVSLYTGLRLLNTENLNISTVEDPIEIQLDGINQVNVNHKIGLSFSAVLKSFLRQDPDIIMVGEIRDRETAEIAIQAAQTGHFVMSTLHTNSAPEALSRLHHMGIPSFNLATSIDLVIAQRLARRLCSNCKIAVQISKQSLQELGFHCADLTTPTFTIFQPVGCSKCCDGYQGRIGIYEVMKITPEISKILIENGDALQLAAASKQAGFPTLKDSGLKKVLRGITSVQEINRIICE